MPWWGSPTAAGAPRGSIAVITEAALQGGRARAATTRLVAEGLVGARFNDAVCKEKAKQRGGQALLGIRGFTPPLLCSGKVESCPSMLFCRVKRSLS